MLVNFSQLEFDTDIQSRESLNDDIVKEYAEQMKNNISFPPVTVFYDGNRYWLADGFHRITAAIVAGKEEFECDVRQGGKREAILHSVGANANHGLRRTNADKRHAVMMLLQDEEWKLWSDREIARQCAVSNKFVSNIRNELSVNNTQMQERLVERNGTTYVMDTTNISKPVENIQDEIIEEEQETYQSESNNDYIEPEIVEGVTPFDMNTEKIVDGINYVTMICEPGEILKLRANDILKIKIKLETLKEKIINVVNQIDSCEGRW